MRVPSPGSQPDAFSPRTLEAAGATQVHVSLFAGACWSCTRHRGCWWWHRRKTAGWPGQHGSTHRCQLRQLHQRVRRCGGCWPCGTPRLRSTFACLLSTGSCAAWSVGRQRRVCGPDQVCNSRCPVTAGGWHAACSTQRLPSACCSGGTAQVGARPYLGGFQAVSCPAGCWPCSVGAVKSVLRS